MVKSVQAQLCLDWLHARYAPVVVLVRRHPLNVLASWLELGYDGSALLRAGHDHACPPDVPPCDPAMAVLDRLAWQIGFLGAALEAAADRVGAVRVVHEEVCRSPAQALPALAASCDLRWGGRAERYVAEHDAPGQAYSTHRRAAEQPDRWRERLSSAQVERARRVLDGFGRPPLTSAG